MSAAEQFWYMGGYARYVWPSVGLTLAVLAWNGWSAWRRLAAAKQRAQRAVQARVQEGA